MRLTKIEYCDRYEGYNLKFNCDTDEWIDFLMEHPSVNNLEIDLCSGKQSFKKCKPKVIFNPPATILFINGKKYVSKAHNEPFDEEKGLLMCLAKAQGITHLELKRMIKGATKQKTKRNDYE